MSERLGQSEAWEATVRKRVREAAMFSDWSDDELAQELAEIADKLEALASEVPGRQSGEVLREKAVSLMREASRRLYD